VELLFQKSNLISQTSFCKFHIAFLGDGMKDTTSLLSFSRHYPIAGMIRSSIELVRHSETKRAHFLHRAAQETQAQ
jgi:hypothetical protein